MSAARQSERRLSIQSADKRNAYITIVADNAKLMSAEPRARSCSPTSQATVETNCSSNDLKGAKSAAALIAKPLVRSYPTTLQLINSSWSEECKTPSSTASAILTHTINAPVTTVASNSALTITTSIVITSAPIMSTSILESQQTSTNKQQQTQKENTTTKHTQTRQIRQETTQKQTKNIKLK